MTTVARLRRLLAVGATFAVLLAGLTLAPAPQVAQAASVSADASAILKALNKKRAALGVQALRSDARVSAFAQAWSAKLSTINAASGTVEPPISGLPVDGESGELPWFDADFEIITGSPKLEWGFTSRASTILGSVLLGERWNVGEYNYAGVGIVEKGNRAYAVVVYASYPDCPVLNLTSTKPAIVGTPRVGTPLTVSGGTWTPSTGLEFAFEWTVGGEWVASSRTYTPTANDLGKPISARVTGDRHCSLPRTTATTAVTVAPGALTKPTPIVSGDRNVGETLTAAVGAWLPIDTEYVFQWLRNGVEIADATSDSYELVALDRGMRIDVRVMGSAVGYTTSAVASATKLMIGYPLLGAAPVPTVIGEAAFGQTLTADPGLWEAAPVTLSYQWRINGVAVAKATNPTFVIPAAAVKKTITVTVTGTKAGFATAARTSVTTGVVASLPLTTITVPVIVGTAKIGSTLKVVPGTWAPSPTLSYSWFRNGVPIANASKSTYKLTTASKKGSVITVRVTAIKAGYTSTSRFSLPSTVR